MGGWEENTTSTSDDHHMCKWRRIAGAFLPATGTTTPFVHSLNLHCVVVVVCGGIHIKTRDERSINNSGTVNVETLASHQWTCWGHHSSAM